MLHFLEKIFSLRPFAGKNRRRRRSGGSGSRREFSSVDLAREKRPPVARREIIIAAFAGMNLVGLPWFVSGVPLWAQWISLALSATAFAFLFLPVGYDEWRSVSASRSLEGLVRFVPFWCGVALMVLFALQGANPRFSVEIDGNAWQLLPERVVRWMPSGVDAPLVAKGLGGMNAWRTMVIFGSPILLFTALFVGVRSRRVVKWLVRAVVASCVCLALFAMGMRAAGDVTLYNTISIYVGSVYGPFTYQNQAGVFFYMAFLLCAALALREWRASAGMLLRGGAHFVLAASACLLAAAAVYSASFAAVVGAVAGALVILPSWWFARPKTEGAEPRSKAGFAIVFLLIFALVAGVFLFSDLEPVWRKLMHKFSLIHAEKVDDRAGLRAATWAMYKDASPLFGAGAGSYRWVMLEYFARIPEFCSKTTGALLFRANYAHCDWLQMLAEWGVTGVAAVLTALGWTIHRLWTFKVWRNAAVWPVVAAGFAVLVHASFDYLFFNPAVLLMFAFTGFVALAWGRETKI